MSFSRIAVVSTLTFLAIVSFPASLWLAAICIGLALLVAAEGFDV